MANFVFNINSAGFGSVNAPVGNSFEGSGATGSGFRFRFGASPTAEGFGGKLLHKAISENQSTTALLQMIKNPDAVQTKDDKGLLPLHRACKHNAPVEVINTLLAAYPEAARLKSLVIERETKYNFGGKLPLHVACESKASIEIINALLASYPDAVKEKSAANTRTKYGIIIDNRESLKNYASVKQNNSQQSLSSKCVVCLF